MASLKTVYEAQDDVPEHLRDSYIEKDGKFIIDIEDLDNHPAVRGLKTAMEAQKQEKRKAIGELTLLKEKIAKVPEDFDPDAYHTLKAKLEEYETDPDRGKDDAAAREAVAARKMLEQKINNMERAHKEALEKKEADIKKKSTFISQLLIDDGLTKALINVGVGKEFMKAAKALLREDVKVVEEGDEYNALVETDTGPLDIDRYVQDWAASDDGKAFIPPARGGDAGGSNKPTKPLTVEKNPWTKDSWNLTEQGRIMKNNRPVAEKLAKAAGVKLPAAESTA